VNRFGLSDAHPTHTPLPSGAEVHLVKHDGEATAYEIKYYQQIIGSLLYVQIGTRPDISFAVARLVQYASNPSVQHLRLAKYVLSYLKGTADLRLRYDGASGNGLVVLRVVGTRIAKSKLRGNRSGLRRIRCRVFALGSWFTR
jgi:hypothetical protein